MHLRNSVRIVILFSRDLIPLSSICFVLQLFEIHFRFAKLAVLLPYKIATVRVCVCSRF
jgi:hypothetical protein